MIELLKWYGAIAYLMTCFVLALFVLGFLVSALQGVYFYYRELIKWIRLSGHGNNTPSLKKLVTGRMSLFADFLFERKVKEVPLYFILSLAGFLLLPIIIALPLYLLHKIILFLIFKKNKIFILTHPDTQVRGLLNKSDK